MRIEQVTLANFRCFGPDPVSIDLAPDITAFIGANSSGKTAVLQALSRLFGVTNEQRRVRLRDFHAPREEGDSPTERTFWIEVLLDFPELRRDEESEALDEALTAIPEFFHQMVVDANGHPKCRFRFDARWIDDGSIEGSVESQFRAIRTLEERFEESQCSNITTADRMRIQMVYVPSVRDGESQVSSFLRSRLWRAISWTSNFRETVKQSGGNINLAFGQETGVRMIVNATRQRWTGLVGADEQESPHFQPIDQRFEEFIRRVEAVFGSGDADRHLELDELGDGQRSLFHIAMALAAIDIEAKLRSGEAVGFSEEHVALPALTLLALEEPENNLAPFFLSRIVAEVAMLTNDSEHAQCILSSHSASLLGRVSPDNVRHFRLRMPDRTTEVRAIDLPLGAEQESKFVREAVQSYPELYFARFVILGEGASEEIVIPRIAAALGLHIDQSFVAVVPLGGRHVNHFWRLLRGLGIPHATLLDLDIGRAGGGWGRIKHACVHLLANGVLPDELFGETLVGGDVDAALNSFDKRKLDKSILEWARGLERHGVFFSTPLDLDMSLLCALPDAYTSLPDGMTGPRNPSAEEEQQQAAAAVLGPGAQRVNYPGNILAMFPWYRYLFLGRGKPDTHFRVLSQQRGEVLGKSAPKSLLALVEEIRTALIINQGEASADVNQD